MQRHCSIHFKGSLFPTDIIWTVGVPIRRFGWAKNWGTIKNFVCKSSPLLPCRHCSRVHFSPLLDFSTVLFECPQKGTQYFGRLSAQAWCKLSLQTRVGQRTLQILFLLADWDEYIYQDLQLIQYLWFLRATVTAV